MLTKPESLKRGTQRRIAATVGLLSVLALAEPALASGRDDRTTAYLPATMSKTQLNEFEQQINDLENLAGKGREKEAMQGLDQLSRSANPSQLLQLVHLVLDRSNPLHDAELGIQIVEFLSRQDTPLKSKAALALARYFASSIHLDDKETAILWARQSLANGEQEAHSLLGDLYSKSGLRLRDLNRALLHYRQLAQHGSIAPLVSFARMLHRTAVTPSECNIDALELIREVLPRLKVEARSGKAAAQKELGRLFWHGVGVAKDRQTAVDWLQKAAQKGDPGARSELAKIALEASGEARLDLLGSAAAEGNRRAVSLLVKILLNRNTASSDRQAIRLIQAAVERGNLTVLRKLNTTYETELLLGSNGERIRFLKDSVQEIEQRVASLFPATIDIAQQQLRSNTYGVDGTIVGSVETGDRNSATQENAVLDTCSQVPGADYTIHLDQLSQD